MLTHTFTQQSDKVAIGLRQTSVYEQQLGIKIDWQCSVTCIPPVSALSKAPYSLLFFYFTNLFKVVIYVHDFYECKRGFIVPYFKHKQVIAYSVEFI